MTYLTEDGSRDCRERAAPLTRVGAPRSAGSAGSTAWRAQGEREMSVREQRQRAVAGGISLGCWLTAVSAGRMIGYWQGSTDADAVSSIGARAQVPVAVSQ